MTRSGPTPGIAAPTPSLATAERTLSTMDTDQPTTVTITLKLSTEEAQDLAVLLPRLVADRLTRFSWRSCGDTDVTVARWNVIIQRIADELGRAGFSAVRRMGGA